METSRLENTYYGDQIEKTRFLESRAKSGILLDPRRHDDDGGGGGDHR